MYFIAITTLNVYNNFISDINTPTTSYDLAISGINISSTVTTANLFYNTIFLNETSTGANFGTACVYTSTTPTIDMRNNILVNTSTPNGTGKTIAYRRSSTTLTTYASTSNNNCFYAGTPGTNKLIFYDGTNSKQTITDYKTYVSPRDAASFRENPPFVNVTSAPYDLHLLATDTSQCESGGIRITSPIAITTDFESNTRFGESGYAGTGTAPDVGADEYNGIRDTYSPIITYTNLSNTTSTSNYITSGWAYISDRSDVDINSGTSPRIYYKKNWHNNTYIDNTSSSNGWKWVESSSTTTPFDFTIDYSKLFGGNAATGDKIMYFVVAQDMVITPNITINSGTFAVQPTSVNLSSSAFPIGGTINSYSISSSSPLAGDYTVSLSLFNLITGKNLISKEFTHKVTKEIAIDKTVEKEFIKNDAVQNDDEGKKITTKIIEIEEKYFALSENGTEYTGSPYIEFTPEIRKQYNFPDSYRGNYANISSATRDINAVGIDASVRFLLLDANYGESGTPEEFPITINAITGASASKTVTIRPSSGITSTISGSSSTSVIKLNGADYVTIDGSNSGGTNKNLTIQNTNTLANTAAIWLSSLGTGAGAIYNTIKNCNIKAGINSLTTYGIDISGTTIGSSGADNDYTTIQNNAIAKANYGIRIQGVSGAESNSPLITENIIGSVNSDEYITCRGIHNYYAPGATISKNEVFNIIYDGSKIGILLGYTSNNCSVSKNVIHSFNHSNTSSYQCVGIWSSVSSSSNSQIDNNVIYDLLNYGTTSASDYYNGITISGGTNFKLYNNSISLTGAFRNTTAGVYSKCLYISSASTNIDIENNVLYNAMTGTSPKTFAIDIVASTTFANSNYNNFYTTGTVLGRFSGTEKSDLSVWRTATSQDAYSLSANPGFTSNTNLLPDVTNSNCWNVNGKGVQIASINSDINGNQRSINVFDGAPDIGAYEITPNAGVSPVDAAMSGTIAAGNTTIFSVGGKNVATITWAAPITGTANFPTSLSVQYRTGEWPANQNNYEIGNVGWKFAPSGSGTLNFSYDITLHYTPALLGNTGAYSLLVAKSDDNGATWNSYSAITNGNDITVSGLESFSIFAITNSNSPLPVKFNSFTSNVIGRNVNLKWITSSETNNYGFEIERAIVSSQQLEFSKIAFVSGKGNSNVATNYEFNDSKLNTGKYKYRLKQIDNNGNFEYHNLNGVIEIGIPAKFNLSQNYPNPFNPVTKIDFDLPVDSKVSLKIYDITGKEVKTLVNDFRTAGYYTVTFDGTTFSSGVYFYRIQSSDNKFVMTKKLLLIK